MVLSIMLVVAIVAFLISANALYVAGEFAAVGARKSRVIRSAQEGNRLARQLLTVLEDSQRLDNYIAASQVGITLSSLALGIYGQQQIAPRLEPWLARLPLDRLPGVEQLAAGGMAAVFVLILLTILQVVLGELVPKSLAVQYPERTAYATVTLMRWSADFLLRPLIVVLNGSGALLLKLLGVHNAGGHAHLHSPEEILILAGESHQGGLLDTDEKELLENAFRLGELTAQDVLIPRTRLVTTAVETPLEETMRLAAHSSHTRIPVYEGDIDHVIGFVHLRDLFHLYRQNATASLRSILRPAPLVPESTPVHEVWDLLNESRSHLAFVFDEYGGISGMITQEDLLEELFGEVQDEFDQNQTLIGPVDDGQVMVHGDVAVARVNTALGLDLPTEEAQTLGGLVLGRLQGRPAQGDGAMIDGIRLWVEDTDGRAVRRVRVDLTVAEDGASPEEA